MLMYMYFGRWNYTWASLIGLILLMNNVFGKVVLHVYISDRIVFC